MARSLVGEFEAVVIGYIDPEIGGATDREIQETGAAPPPAAKVPYQPLMLWAPVLAQ